MKTENSSVPGVHSKTEVLYAAFDDERHEGVTLLECIVAQVSKVKTISL